MPSLNEPTLTKSFLSRLDAATVALYILLVAVGITAVFSVEYQEGQSLFLMNSNHMKQVVWLGISLLAGIIILFTDSKFFSSVAFLSYTIGLLLLVATIFLGRDTKGSHSWLYFGPIGLQPGEVHKIFTSLALARFLSLPDVDFSALKDRLIAAGMVLLPALLIILQSETGLALVYFAFFLVLYREGLPNGILIAGFSIIALTLATLLVDRRMLLYVIGGLALLVGLLMRRTLSRNSVARLLYIGSLVFMLVFVQFAVPFAFKHALKGYQIERVYSMLGRDVPAEYIKADDAEQAGGKKKDTDYNVRQSKIAIGSGGLVGKGLLNGTSTRGSFVPEQHTDFIFCSIGEQFGFVGSAALIVAYLLLLLRIVFVAERQRSPFSRIYAYCVASILFFHLAVNISMTIGLAPVIGITLPFLSYGGTSLLSFTTLIFILLRLDADRSVNIR